MLQKIWQNKIFSGEICFSVNELENQKWEPLTIMINRSPQIPAAISWLERLGDFSKVVAIDLQKFGTTTWMCQTLVIVLQMENKNKSLSQTYLLSLLNNIIEDISYSTIWLHEISKINGWKVMFSHIDPSKEGSSAITAETVIQSQNQTPTPIQWDPTYIKSLPGILKICSMVSYIYICIYLMPLTIHLLEMPFPRTLLFLNK